MAASSRMTTEELSTPKKSWNRGHRGMIINDSPIAVEPHLKTTTVASAVLPARKVSVLYYLSRNGHLEHPHLVDVPLSSPNGLYLRDIINTLNCHRGKGMANMYSWSFKRSYKNGYVWHDATEDDLIQPNNGHEYVLKGSELLQTHASQIPPEKYHTSDNCGPTTTAAAAAAAMVIRRNQSWSSFDNPQEYFVVKCESNRELAAKFAPDAATQTEEKKREGHASVELSTEEIPSPPPSNSSSEVSEAVSRSRYVDRTGKIRDRGVMVEDQHGRGGRMKATQVLMQLITCGADSPRDVIPLKSKQDEGCTASVAYGKGLKSEPLNH